MKYFCHPAIKKWLSKASDGIVDISNSGSCVISSYLAQKGAIHTGLLKAVKFRLVNPTQHPIIILSFQSKHELTLQDTYAILSLPGTAYVRLPVSKEALLSVIKIYNTALSIPATEWEQFAIPAYTRLLKEILHRLTHGNPNALGNSALNPLRLACVSYLSFPAGASIVSEKLENLRQFIAQGAMAEFISMAANAATENDPFLLGAANLAEQLEQLAVQNCHSEGDAKKLIFSIDQINQTWSQLLTI